MNALDLLSQQQLTWSCHNRNHVANITANRGQHVLFLYSWHLVQTMGSPHTALQLPQLSVARKAAFTMRAAASLPQHLTPGDQTRYSSFVAAGASKQAGGTT